MTLHEVFAMNRYCRADKRALDRAIKLCREGRDFVADQVYLARLRVTAHWWERLPEAARNAIRNPMEGYSCES
jgi:hypothetical protein